MPIDTSIDFVAINIAVITISDSRTIENDTSGDTLEKRILTNKKAYEVYKDEKNSLLEHIASISAHKCPFCQGMLSDVRPVKPTKYIKTYLQCVNFEKCGFQMPSLRKMKKI